jgi:hypothetical protein
MLPAINLDSQVAARKLPLQALHYSEHRIIGGGNSKDNLKLRILLIAERAKALVRFRLRAA